MQKMMLPVLVLMATAGFSASAFPSEGKAQQTLFDNSGREVPVCVPTYPCGPGSRERVVLENNGRGVPMCPPGYPCGPGNRR